MHKSESSSSSSSGVNRVGQVARRCTVEMLEGRALLSGGSGGGTSTIVPHVTGDGGPIIGVPEEWQGLDAADAASVRVDVRGKPLVRAGKAYTFKAIFAAGEPIDPGSVSYVRVTGPGGYGSDAEVVRFRANDARTKLVATYRVPLFGGAGQFTASLARFADPQTPTPTRTPTPTPVPTRELTTFAVKPRGPVTPAPEPLPPASPAAFSAELTRAYAWCDHMPTVGRLQDDRQFLILEVTLTNPGSAPLAVKLDETRLAFDDDAAGWAAPGVSIMDVGGRATGKRTVVLQPGEVRTVDLRGDGVFPEGNHDRRLHVTLTLSSDRTAVTTRNSADIVMTQ